MYTRFTPHKISQKKFLKTAKNVLKSALFAPKSPKNPKNFLLFFEKNLCFLSPVYAGDELRVYAEGKALNGYVGAANVFVIK